MKDDINSLIKKLEESPLIKKTFYIGLPILTLKNLTKKEIIARLENPKNNLYKEVGNHYDDIENEKKRLLADLKDFLTESSTIKQYKDSNINEIIHDYNNWYIRLQRLQLVYTPIFYKSILRKGEYEYDKIKIVWIEDNGNKSQNSTRTYGQTGEDHLREILEKFLVENEKAKNPKYLERIKTADDYFHSDLIVQIDKEEWIFEFKIKDKSEYITELVRKDLWQFYQDKYLSS